jgi:hypothetical protein
MFLKGRLVVRRQLGLSQSDLDRGGAVWLPTVRGGESARSGGIPERRVQSGRDPLTARRPKITWGGPPLMPEAGKDRLHVDLAPPAGSDQ